jgi:hypothetical protein
MAFISRELVSIRSSIIEKQHHACVLRFGHIGEEIEPGVEVEQETLRMSLLRLYIVGTLKRVPEKEDGEAQSYEIVISIFSVELGRMASRVSSGIRVLSLPVSLSSLQYTPQASIASKRVESTHPVGDRAEPSIGRGLLSNGL